MITVGVREFRDYFVSNTEHPFITDGLRWFLIEHYSGDCYAVIDKSGQFAFNTTVIDQLRTWTHNDFMIMWGETECIVHADSLLRWQQIGLEYMLNNGGTGIVDEHTEIRIARIGLLNDILDKCGDVSFVFEV